MPSNKDFKRLVRGRMRKTGESYTTARAQLLRNTTRQTPAPAHYAKLAGMSDATLKAKTGYVGALGEGARSRRGPHLAASQDRRVRAREVQGAGLVVPEGHRGLRAHQGVARDRAATDKTAATRMKQYWEEQLGALREVLA